jgi:hypothetical protein
VITRGAWCDLATDGREGLGSAAFFVTHDRRDSRMWSIESVNGGDYITNRYIVTG